MASEDGITIEIIAPDPEGGLWVCLRVPANTTIKEALVWIDRPVGATESVGIWGQKKPEDCPLMDGDRIEIYLPLLADPKLNRQQRAKQAMLQAKQQRELKKQSRLKQKQLC